MLRAALGEHRVNPTHPQAVPNGLSVVATVAEQTARTTPWPPAFTVESGNCMIQTGTSNAVLQSDCYRLIVRD
jgi:hypothetical protein